MTDSAVSASETAEVPKQPDKKKGRGKAWDEEMRPAAALAGSGAEQRGSQ